MNALQPKVKVRIHNRFDVFKTNKKTGKTVKVAQAENILLDQFWTYFNAFGWGTYIWLGSGTGTIESTRTTMFNKVLNKSATFETQDVSLANEGIFSQRRYIVLNETENNGVTFSEIGLGTSTRLLTHAMLKDMNGNTVTIEKTDTDILTIYGTAYAYIDPSLWQEHKIIIPWYSKNTAGTYYAKMLELMLGYSSGPLDSNYMNVFVSEAFLAANAPKGYQVAPTIYSTRPTASWSAANKKISWTTIRFGAADGNGKNYRAVGIATSSVVNSAIFNISIGLIGNPDWSGILIEGESIGVGDGSNKDFCTACGFIKSGAVVYVNGVAETGVTIDEGLPNVNTMELFVNPIKVDNWFLIPGIEGSPTKSDTAELIVENPYYSDIGIDLMHIRGCVVYCSNDLDTWTLVSDSKNADNASVDTSAYRSYRYWKVIKPTTADDYYQWENFRSSDLTTPRNVHFIDAPANGSVITIDYETEECPKTSDYVLDVQISVEFGEYTEGY